ncbi:hypothetical protein DK26_01530 [Bosea sp. WAO]|uniref:hypothetical protein n=1 Tax=Bosea sp. WAO TaxID=406341 RepID=UPI0007495248|nr:hypothetical protein [Bosea sp. WAO]KUL97373.1 hypothetical protein DK26_01530 [Bosea sp. WAO]
MRIESKEEFDAAAARATALSDAAEGTPAADELAELIAAIRGWEARREPEGHGPEENPEPGTNRSPDDLPFSGLPANVGKLRE